MLGEEVAHHTARCCRASCALVLRRFREACISCIGVLRWKRHLGSFAGFGKEGDSARFRTRSTVLGAASWKLHPHRCKVAGASSVAPAPLPSTTTSLPSLSSIPPLGRPAPPFASSQAVRAPPPFGLRQNPFDSLGLALALPFFPPSHLRDTSLRPEQCSHPPFSSSRTPARFRPASRRRRRHRRSPSRTLSHGRTGLVHVIPGG